MNAKGKAEELFIKFYPNWYDNGLVAKRKYAKEHALIAVNEIILAIRFTDAKSDFGYVGYWNEVKKEIEKL
jgi:hypothetical protein